MDDSNDRIRVECASAFEKYLSSVPRNYDSAQFDYIVRGLVVHLDDQNSEVCARMYKRQHVKCIALMKCMYMYMHTYTRTNTSADLHKYTRTYTYTYTYACIHASILLTYVHTCLHTCKHSI